MRGREFLMKDGYSFDLDEAGARRSYQRMFVAYLRTFARLGVKAIPMRAETGPIGGDLSHEFIVLADTGESDVYCDRRVLDLPVPGIDVDYDGDLEPLIRAWTSLYAATSDVHDAARYDADVPEAHRLRTRGIEVGQIFYFGTRYSQPMRAQVTMPDGSARLLHGGSYGIGVSRLAGAIIEACHDDAGIAWPDAAAPFDLGIVDAKAGDAATAAVCGDLHARLAANGVDALWDDTDARAGAKFANMDLIGLPWQVVVGPRGLANGVVELKRRATGERMELSPDDLVAKFATAAAVTPR
jgi:prolyl-tRNA synthetase